MKEEPVTALPWRWSGLPSQTDGNRAPQLWGRRSASVVDLPGGAEADADAGRGEHVEGDVRLDGRTVHGHGTDGATDPGDPREVHGAIGVRGHREDAVGRGGGQQGAGVQRVGVGVGQPEAASATELDVVGHLGTDLTTDQQVGTGAVTPIGGEVAGDHRTSGDRLGLATDEQRAVAASGAGVADVVVGATGVGDLGAGGDSATCGGFEHEARAVDGLDVGLHGPEAGLDVVDVVLGGVQSTTQSRDAAEGARGLALVERDAVIDAVEGDGVGVAVAIGIQAPLAGDEHVLTQGVTQGVDIGAELTALGHTELDGIVLLGFALGVLLGDDVAGVGGATAHAAAGAGARAEELGVVVPLHLGDHLAVAVALDLVALEDAAGRTLAFDEIDEEVALREVELVVDHVDGAVGVAVASLVLHAEAIEAPGHALGPVVGLEPLQGRAGHGHGVVGAVAVVVDPVVGAPVRGVLDVDLLDARADLGRAVVAVDLAVDSLEGCLGGEGTGRSEVGIGQGGASRGNGARTVAVRVQATNDGVGAGHGGAGATGQGGRSADGQKAHRKGQDAESSHGRLLVG